VAQPGDKCVGGGLNHHLDCETANGPISMAVCRKCGYERLLWNTPPLKDSRQISKDDRRLADEFTNRNGDGDRDHQAWA
jgi:hypothetical protein